MAIKLVGRARRKLRVRKKISGTGERPRLTVFRSNKQIYAAVVDDVSGNTLVTVGSKKLGPEGNKSARAGAVGEAIAQACIGKGIKSVVFDRNGYIYHGRVKALADGARKGGLEF
ncbi:MAG TPA: 50S ribosomal protein L18 [Polyangiales bacterium]|nr:50S ribosomal protein L18 [Polyangiales bacterium]